jgi:tRNA dimethylallyltransferase
VRTADILKAAGREAPVLLAGPTASGKSALAMEIADRTGGAIVNADALQVFADWRILTARPTPADEAAVPHRLYGHVAGHEPYSVGHWLRDLRPLLGEARPIIVGGTGLYFTALIEGLADIPATPAEVRAEADARMAEHGPAPLIADLDAATAARIDRLNPVRIQRAWEVQRATGRGLAAWQDATPPPLLPLDRTHAFLIPGDRDWLAPRIARRTDAMLEAGVLEEARANRPGWSPALPSAKAIGAAELMAHLDGRLTLDAAREAIVTLTRQYAKRQRTWFRARMSAWVPVHPD